MIEWAASLYLGNGIRNYYIRVNKETQGRLAQGNKRDQVQNEKTLHEESYS